MNLKQQDLVMGSHFAQDLSKPLNINGRQSSWGYYNLTVHIAGLRLLVNAGIIPSRGWKLKTLKEYYDITGRKETLLEKLEFIKKEMLCR